MKTSRIVPRVEYDLFSIVATNSRGTFVEIGTAIMRKNSSDWEFLFDHQNEQFTEIIERLHAAGFEVLATSSGIEDGTAEYIATEEIL